MHEYKNLEISKFVKFDFEHYKSENIDSASPHIKFPVWLIGNEFVMEIVKAPFNAQFIGYIFAYSPKTAREVLKEISK